MTNYPLHMMQYHGWANQVLLQHIQELPAEVWQQQVNTSFPTIADAFAHIHAVDHMWYMVLTGVEMSAAIEASQPLIREYQLYSIDECMKSLGKLNKDYQKFLQSEPDLERSIMLNNPYVGIRHTRLAEIALHVINHGTYHRGNVSTMLRQLGHASVMNDYVLFWYAEQQPTPSI